MRRKRKGTGSFVFFARGSKKSGHHYIKGDAKLPVDDESLRGAAFTRIFKNELQDAARDVGKPINPSKEIDDITALNVNDGLKKTFETARERYRRHQIDDPEAQRILHGVALSWVARINDPEI